MYSGPDTLERVGFPIRTSADQRSLASPRGFSQRATSFIASWRQGIHRTPLSRSISHHHRPHAGPNRALHDKLACHTNRLTQGHRTYFRQHFIQPIHLHLSKNTPSRHPLRDPRQAAVIGSVHHANKPCRTTRGRTAGKPTPTHRAISCPAPASRPGASIPNPSREHPATTSEPAAEGLEANGFEPMTPCLQSRCSTS